MATMRAIPRAATGEFQRGGQALINEGDGRLAVAQGFAEISCRTPPKNLRYCI